MNPSHFSNLKDVQIFEKERTDESKTQVSSPVWELKAEHLTDDILVMSTENLECVWPQ